MISAKREETLRYQFVRAGTYTLPDLTISWWDPKTGKLEQEVLPGETVTVRMSEAAVAVVKEERKIWPWLLGVVTLVVALWFRRQQLSEWYHDWQKWRHRPEVVTSKDLLEACRNAEAKVAYLAAMSWQRALGISLEEIDHDDYTTEISALSERLFGNHESPGPWSGRALEASFQSLVRERNRRKNRRREAKLLPALNSPEL